MPKRRKLAEKQSNSIKKPKLMEKQKIPHHRPKPLVDQAAGESQMTKQKKVLTEKEYLGFIDPTPRPWLDPKTGEPVMDEETGEPQLFTPANCAEWVRMYEDGEIIIVPTKSDEKEEGSKKNQSAPVSSEYDLVKMELGGESQDVPDELS